MSVPLMPRGRVLGIITHVARSGSRYENTDLELAEELGRRAALALENGRLYAGAQEALRARDEFLSIGAHEIRGPMTSIHLAVQSIRQGKLPPEATPRALSIIEREDRRLSRFVAELLDLAHIQAGRLQFDMREVDLVRILREVASRLEPDLARSGSTLQVVTKGPVIGNWDPMRIDQIVTNLLSNAIKFGRGKPIEVSADAEESKARLVVNDYGMGISPEMRERVFLPFERAVSSRHYGGLGLGLYIVKAAVEGMGGTIRVESTVDEGTTFTVELPR